MSTQSINVTAPAGVTFTAQITQGLGFTIRTDNSTFVEATVTNTNLIVNGGAITLTPSDSSGAVVIQVAWMPAVNCGTGTGNGTITVTPSSVTLSPSNSFQSTVMVQTSSASQVTYMVTFAPVNSWLGVSWSSTTVDANDPATISISGNSSFGSPAPGSITITPISPAGQQAITIPVQQTTASGGAANGVSVSPGTSFTFNAPVGSFTVLSQTFQVTTAASVTINADQITADSDQDWLAVSSTSTGSSVIASADPSGLSAGTYHGTITIPSSTGTTTISITLVVGSSSGSGGGNTGGSNMSVGPSSLSFAVESGSGSGAGAQTIEVASPVGGSYMVSADQTWIVLSATQGTIPAGQFFTVNVNTGNLTAGTYNGNVTVTTSDNVTHTIPVTLLLTGPGNPVITASPGSATFQYPGILQGSIGLAPSSGDPVTFTASTNTSWISPHLLSGGILQITVDPTGLPAGLNAGSITVTGGNLANSPMTIPVLFQINSTVVGGTGNITVSPSPVTLNYQIGGSTPVTQTVTVSNATSGTSPIPVNVNVATNKGGNWLSTNSQNFNTSFNLVISANPTGLAAGTYTGTVTLSPNGGQQVQITVTLNVTNPTIVSATPTNLSFVYRLGDTAPAAQGIQVSGGGAALNFTAQATSSSGWLSVSPASGTTPTTGTTTLNASVNTSGLAAGTYSGTITVSGTNGATGSTTISVALTVTAPPPTISAVANAASGASATISPGEIVSIFGTAIGPTPGVSLKLDTNNKVSTTLGNVQVFFNGVPAPLTFVSATQVNCVVPYEISGIQHPQVFLRYEGVDSNGLSLNAAATVPGIFTSNSTGSGPAAALNTDGITVNSPNTPVAKGGAVSLYVTGEGITSPAGVTGALTTVTQKNGQPFTPQPILPLAVTLDGQPVTVLFFGEAPGLVAGVMQINIAIPTNARSGNLAIQFSVGGNSSQTGVTISVQ